MYVAYDNALGHYLTISNPSVGANDVLPTQSYEPFTNEHRIASEFKGPHAVVSKILSVSLVHDTNNPVLPRVQKKLKNPIMISFHTSFTPDKSHSNPRCVWWDQSIMNWSSTGCALEWQNETHTMCHCFHFAHYAVVMDVQQSPKILTVNGESMVIMLDRLSA